LHETPQTRGKSSLPGISLSPHASKRVRIKGEKQGETGNGKNGPDTSRGISASGLEPARTFNVALDDFMTIAGNDDERY